MFPKKAHTDDGELIMEFIGSKTERNVLAAFAGESQARNRYSYFASVAKKEGYEQIAGVFLETADEEKEHAKLFFSYLKGGMVEITAGYPAGVIGSTKENLKAAADGEMMEWGTLYPAFAGTAKDEGFLPIANLFKQVAVVEKYHEQRYNRSAVQPGKRNRIPTRFTSKMVLPGVRVCIRRYIPHHSNARMQSPTGLF